MTYYRWLKDTSTWQYIGQEGPYYTKSEIDTTLLPYVQNTDYATENIAGVLKGNQNGLNITNNGVPTAGAYNYNLYLQWSDGLFISKRTLENVITGKQLVNQTYVDNIVGDIESILETLDIGNGV